MKQIAVLVVSLFVLVLSALWEVKYIENSSRYILSDISYTKNQIQNDNYEEAKNHIENIKNTWGSIRPVWKLFIHHDKLDNIEKEIEVLKSYIDLQDKNEAITSLEILIFSLNNIYEDEKLILENIL